MPGIFPFRIRFTKQGRLRFLSHHDLMRVMERAIRRSDLPIRFTEGFNPHPILSFPTALGLGIETLDEVMELELTSWIPPRQIQSQLTPELPEGMTLLSVEAFARTDRQAVDFVEYEALLLEPPPDLPGRIQSFFEKKSHVVTRRSDKGSKQVDVRPYVMALQADGSNLLMRIQITDDGTAKPEEIVESLGIPANPRIRIVKTFTQLRRRS